MNKTTINENGYKLEWKKGTWWNEKTFGWYLECKGCNEPTRVGSEDLAWVQCSKCTQRSLKEFDDVRS